MVKQRLEGRLTEAGLLLGHREETNARFYDYEMSCFVQKKRGGSVVNSTLPLLSKGELCSPLRLLLPYSAVGIVVSCLYRASSALTIFILYIAAICIISIAYTLYLLAGCGVFTVES